MKIKTYRSLGLNVPISVFESVDEYNAAAKRPNENACLEDANDNIVYRGALADYRDAFTSKVEAITGIERKSEAVMLKDGKPRVDKDTGEPVLKYLESEAEYIDRALVESKRTIDSFQDTANEVAANLKADPTARERATPGPKTPPKSVYELADKLIASGKATAVASQLETVVGHSVGADREALARAIHEDQLNEMRKAKAKWEA